MQPQIALTYSSQQGNGYVGVGWGISGLSSIYRCNLTYAQDGAPAPVALQTSDGYCMDGQRLRRTGGTYGMAGSTYQTEVANFINVTAYGSAGNGPAYFIAQDRNGRTYTYGNGGNSQVTAGASFTAYVWALNQVSDPAGNTMTISYSTTNATSAVVPSVISWTPSSQGGGTYNYTMTFGYGATNSSSAPGGSDPHCRLRPAGLRSSNTADWMLPICIVNGYVAGAPIQNTNLLSTIAIAYSGSTVKEYFLSYTSSPTTGRQTLTQVKECADAAATNCLQPTTISYQNGQAGVATTVTSALSSAPSQLVSHYDFNGDGLEDLAYCSGGTIYVALRLASGGYGTPQSTGAACDTGHGTALYGDFLGSGQDGILAPNGGTWYYYAWNGSAFAGAPTGLAYTGARQYVAADVDGDGRPDLIELDVNSGVQIYARLNTSSATAASFGNQSVSYTYSAPPGTQVLSAQLYSNSDNTNTLGVLRGFDFNGDGRQDLLLTMVTLANGGSPSPSSYQLISSPGPAFSSYPFPSITPSLVLLNWNSDACTDYITSGVLHIAGCNGTAPSSINLGSAAIIGAMDWDGDGLTDLLVANGSTIGVYLSTGNGVSSLKTTSVPYSSSNTYFTFDADGDGQDDLGAWDNNSHAVSYYRRNAPGQPPDLLTTVVDGYGNFVQPSYVSIAQGNYTLGSDAAYPDKNYVGPLYVVSQAQFSDPSSTGGTYSQTFSYSGAWQNLQGRGFEGFAKVVLQDSRNAGYGSIYDNEYYERAFPYTGMNSKRELQDGSFNIIQTVKTPAQMQINASGYPTRTFTYFSGSTTTQREVSATPGVNGALITTSTTTWQYDNYGNATSMATTVTDNDSASVPSYSGTSWTTTTTNSPSVDTTHWCLSLLSKSVVAYTGGPSGSAAVTRTRGFTPDTTYCRYTQIATEPAGSSYPQYGSTETLGYDLFGNLNSDSVQGIGMAVRTTTLNWGTTGQFPMSLQDPSLQGTSPALNYTFSYDFRYGLLSNATDPNGVGTSWTYGDGFGRKTQETRADGTTTQWSYYDCGASGGGGCLIGSHGTNVTHQVLDTSSHVITDGTDYNDSVDRKLVSNQRLLATGTYDRNEVRYDSLGRVAQTVMPCTWSGLTTKCPYLTTNSYDVLNRLTQSQRPTSAGNSAPLTTVYGYAGRTTTITDPRGNSRMLVKDVNGALRQTKDAMGYAITLAYDAAGSKTLVTDSLSNTLWSGSYVYGLGAYLTSMTDMDRGAWAYTSDALGEVVGWTDATKTQSFSESYDPLGRPLTRTEPDLFTQWTYGYSATAKNVGKLASVCTGTGTGPTNCTTSPGYGESETYDSVGRQTTRVITLPSHGSYTYQWGYDSATGLLSSLTYPQSFGSTPLKLSYAYQNGILQSITNVADSPNVMVWQANSTNPAGQVTQETLGNGIVVNHTYDAVTHWLASVTAGVGGGAGAQNQSFSYDEVGNLTLRQDNTRALNEGIWYDNDYRLSYTKLNGTQNLSINYDGMGNITSRTDVAGGATWTYDLTHKHQVTQAGSSTYGYAYDANGNVKSRWGGAVAWTSYNYPSSIATTAAATGAAETVAFQYGPDRQRWVQTYTDQYGAQENTYYIGGLLELRAGSGFLTDYRHYIYAGSEPVAVYHRNSAGTTETTYFLSDHEGSVAALTSGTGTTPYNESFSPFGQRRNPTTWSGAASYSDLSGTAGYTRQGYTFQTQLGLYMALNHMNGRVEDAGTGRFLSPDSYLQDETNPQNYSPYTYTYNNPLSYIDPTGLLTVCIPSYVFIPSTTPAPGDPLQVTIGAGWVPGPLNCFTIPDINPTPPKTPHGPRSWSLQGKPQGKPRPCGGGAIARWGATVSSFGQGLQRWGNNIAAAGSTFALASAGVSLTGLPAEPGIILGGDVAAVGGAGSLIGSGVQWVGGIMQNNSQGAASGFFSAAQNLLETAAFSVTERFGLPGFPLGVPDPLDSLTEAAANAASAGAPTCH